MGYVPVGAANFTPGALHISSEPAIGSRPQNGGMKVTLGPAPSDAIGELARGGAAR